LTILTVTRPASQWRQLPFGCRVGRTFVYKQIQNQNKRFSFLEKVGFGQSKLNFEEFSAFKDHDKASEEA